MNQMSLRQILYSVILTMSPATLQEKSGTAMQCDCDCDCGDCACPSYGNDNSLSSDHFLSTPVVYSLELTPVCNNKCTGCGNPNTGSRLGFRNNPLNLGSWKSILDAIQAPDIFLKITGGEPTLHPQFIEIISEIALRKIPFVLFTNGRWPSSKNILSLLKSIPDFRGMLISLHGSSAKTHEYFTGVAGSWRQATEQIRIACEQGLNVSTSTVIMRQNIGELEQIASLSRRLGASNAVFARYLGHPLGIIEPDNEELKKAISTIEWMISEGQPVHWGDCVPQCFVPNNSSTSCLAGIAYCAIDAWGNIRPCAHDPLICGNVLDTPIDVIWHGQAMQAWRSYLSEDCKTCLNRDSCRGGCRATALMRSGTDPLMAQSALLSRDIAEQKDLYLFEGLRPNPRFHCPYPGHTR